MKKTFAFLLVIFLSTAGFTAEAQSRSAPRMHSTLSYDLSASSGTYNELSYNEIQLGLNWYVLDWLNWRNSVFQRFGSKIDSVTGLDTALLATTEAFTDSGSLGVQAFIGPGYRFANQDNSAVFGQAGIVFALGGLHLGIGAKSFYYSNPRVDSTGYEYPRTDNQLFIIVGGSGTL